MTAIFSLVTYVKNIYIKKDLFEDVYLCEMDFVLDFDLLLVSYINKYYKQLLKI